jgi:hypothetical protein
MSGRDGVPDSEGTCDMTDPQLLGQLMAAFQHLRDQAVRTRQAARTKRDLQAAKPELARRLGVAQNIILQISATGRADPTSLAGIREFEASGGLAGAMQEIRQGLELDRAIGAILRQEYSVESIDEAIRIVSRMR